MIGRLILVFFTFILTASNSIGQELEIADTMESNGKIYVVLGVILIIFGGIIIYVFQTGRKVKYLEEKLKELEEKA